MKNNEPVSIASLLNNRNASPVGKSGDTVLATKRSDLTNLIRENYPTFEPIRDLLLKRKSTVETPCTTLSSHGKEIVGQLEHHGLIEKVDGENNKVLLKDGEV